MLNEMQSRNYNRCQKLFMYLTDHTTVFSTYTPFNKEKQTFDLNFDMFKDYISQKHTDGTTVTSIQKELKSKIGLQVANICATATVYAEQYNNPTLAAQVCYTKSDIIKLKDADVYTLVQSMVNALFPYLTDTHFMEYDITQEMLDAAMTNATAFRNNIGKGTVIDNGGSIANQKINEVIKQLDKNVKTFDRLINRFAATHPDFVAGYRINATLESASTRRTGIEGTITDAASGKTIANALVVVVGKNKEAVTDGMGNYAIISMYGGEYEIAVSATGFTGKTVQVRVMQGKTIKVNIKL